MMPKASSTIAAIASPVGICARIVVRLSGPQSHHLIRLLQGGSVPEMPSAGVIRVNLHLPDLQVPAVILLFAAGRSYTGQQSAEIHLPGNPLLAQMVLQQLYHLGAVPAEPGEFTSRAFFNGQLDLSEAEGVAATINAQNQRELDAARKLQGGELTRRLSPISEELTQTLALIEAGIDFSEEDISFLSSQSMVQHAMKIRSDLLGLISQSIRFERLAHEPCIVLYGRPNAGKSTLLNYLAGRNRAIVSPVAGTTRDILWADASLPRGRIRVVDTAGLVCQEDSSPRDDIARQMRLKAMEAIAAADVLVLVREVNDPQEPFLLERKPDLVVISKCDQPSQTHQGGDQYVSALTAVGMPALCRRLDELAFGGHGGETLALNARHLRQINLAVEELEIVAANAGTLGDELAAVHFRCALDALGEISGMVLPDEVLGRVFAMFCIGK